MQILRPLFSISHSRSGRVRTCLFNRLFMSFECILSKTSWGKYKSWWGNHKDRDWGLAEPCSPPLLAPIACSVLYLTSVETESLTGPQAVAKASSAALSCSPRPTPAVVHFKVSAQGITLTDNQRKYVHGAPGEPPSLGPGCPPSQV